MEKESILNSYKIFLKTCNFDIQILIQSKKEDLTNHIEKIKINSKIYAQHIKNYNYRIESINKRCQQRPYITRIIKIITIVRKN